MTAVREESQGRLSSGNQLDLNPKSNRELFQGFAERHCGESLSLVMGALAPREGIQVGPGRWQWCG